MKIIFRPCLAKARRKVRAPAATRAAKKKQLRFVFKKVSLHAGKTGVFIIL